MSFQDTGRFCQSAHVTDKPTDVPHDACILAPQAEEEEGTDLVRMLVDDMWEFISNCTESEEAFFKNIFSLSKRVQDQLGDSFSIIVLYSNIRLDNDRRRFQDAKSCAMKAFHSNIHKGIVEYLPRFDSTLVRIHCKVQKKKHCSS
jgi:hypothetical protein